MARPRPRGSVRREMEEADQEETEEEDLQEEADEEEEVHAPVRNSPTPTVTGGTSPYTYVWSRLGGGASAVSLAYAPSTKDMAFSATGTDQRFYVTFKCVATDSSGTPKTAENYVTLAIGFNVSAYPDDSEPV